MESALRSGGGSISKWMDDTEEMDGRAEDGHRAGEVERVSGSGGSGSYDRFSSDGLQPEVTGYSLSGELPWLLLRWTELLEGVRP